MTLGITARKERDDEPVVGRADELGALEGALDQLDVGGPGAVALLGEAGIGKTRLLRQLSANAEKRGHLVLSGSASELEGDLPFCVFVDALDEYVEGLDLNQLDALDDDVLAELAHVFPSLSPLAGDARVALQDERYRSHRAVRALLEHLAEPKPLVLMLDDLHWADPASVELLGALLRRPPSGAVLMALAMRPRQLSKRLAAALERADRGAALTRIELGPLTVIEARELLGETFAAGDAAVLYEESGGNPFYLEQLARSPAPASRAAPDSGSSLGGIGVPYAVAASLSEELTLLSAEARLILEGAAVAGDPFEPELAAVAAGISEAAAMDAVDELLALDLIRTTDLPRRFRFRHPLVRRAAYESTAGGWRIGAHERCAEALAARGLSAAARAHHVERSAREGDLAAIAVLSDAGEVSARLAPESAAQWFAAALRLLPPTAAAEDRVDLLLACARALAAAGHFAESHDAMLEAVSIVPGPPTALYTTVATTCAGVERTLGLYEQAHARLVMALQLLPESSSVEGAMLLIELTLNEFYRSRYDAMHSSAPRAVREAKAVGDEALTASALAVQALAEVMTGRTESARSHRAEAAALVDNLSDDALGARPDAAGWLAIAEAYLDRYTEADVHASRALELTRATGRGDPLHRLYPVLPRVWYMRGKLAEAADLLDGAIEAGRLFGSRPALAMNLSNRSAVALAVDDLELALTSAEEAVELTQEPAESFFSAWAGSRLASILVETGQPARAVEVLVSRAGGEELTLIGGSWKAYCLELLTRCRLMQDRAAEAERAAGLAKAVAAAVLLPLASAWAERAIAAVELHSGNAALAVESAFASADVAEEVGAPIEAALSRVLAGRALAQLGQSERAVTELQRAAAEFDACGALRYRESAARELGKLGHRPHRRTRAGKTEVTGIASLTERELQVARLADEGKTNPQIGAELFLSKKTVESHLRNVFRKLGVSSRVALARAVERADRTATAP